MTEIKKNSDLRMSFLQDEINKLKKRNEKLQIKLQNNLLNAQNSYKQKNNNNDNTNSQHNEVEKNHLDNAFSDLNSKNKVLFF